MIIHNPEITGSLSFPRQDGTKVIIQLSTEGGLETVVADATGSVTGTPQSNFSGSFTGSFQGDGSQLTGVAASGLNIDLFSAGVIAADDNILFSDTDDSGNEKKGTFKSGLNSVGVISGSVQVDVEQTTNFNAFSSSIASTFAGLSSNFDDLVNNPFTQSVSSVTVSKSIVPSTSTIDLGTAVNPFRDLYLSSASLYIDGQQVLSSNNSELIITTDVNQSLKLVETSADTITLQTENGDITIAATGTGNIELNAPVQILAGKQILSSDGNAIQFGEDINVQGNITVTGTVDSVDIAAFKSAFDTLNGKALVSGSSQILTLVSIDEDNMATNSDTKLPTQQSVKQYVDTKVAALVDSAPGALDTLNELAAALGDDANFSTTISNTIAGKVSQSLEIISGDGLTGGGNLTTNRTLAVGAGDGISVSADSVAVDNTVLRTTGFGVISGSSQVNADSITNFDSNVLAYNNSLGVISGSSQVNADSIVNFDSNVKTKLDAEGVISGSSQVNADSIVNFDSNVKDKLNVDGVISGSSQVELSSASGFGSISSHISSTSNPHNVTAAQVGLGNVTNESKATMFTDAALTGTPTAPTATTTTNSTQIATTAFVQGRIDEIIGTAGAALDTLGELSASLSDDQDALTALTTTVSGKLTKSSNLSDLTDVAQARTNLGVDPAGTDNSTDVTLAGSYDYLTIAGQVITRNQVDASTDISNLNTTNVSEGTNLYYTDSRVKTKLNSDGVISGSSQVSLTTSDVSEGTNLYYTDARVKTKLNADLVVSGSATQVRTFLNVEDGATADQSASEIKTAYESNANTNAFTDALLSKLNGIEAGATADQTDEEIQDIIGAMVSSNTESGITVTYDDTAGKLNFSVTTQSDENFTSALLSKLNGIEALADVTDAANVDAAGAVMNSDTSTAAMSFVIDEDTMASNTATKVPTQQSVKTYVDNKVSALVDAAPGTLDTLNELAAALGDDANFSTTVTNSIATKANSSITISAGNGLSGGGNLTANRTLSMSGTYTGDFAVTGNITATADIVAYASSDERLKKNIELISDPIGKIKQLKGVTWVWKDEASDVAKQSPNVGVIAQDVEKVLPQVVKDRENGYKGVDYGKMVGLLIEAIKDQQKQIDDLKSRLG